VENCAIFRIMFGKVLRNYLPLLLIILLAITLRFVFLNKVPNAIGGDEMTYVLNAKASFLTGYDIFGSWSPWQGLLFQYPKGEAQAELPYLLDAPIIGLLPLSLLAAHLTNAILAVLLVIFIYLVAKELLGEKAGLFAAFLASINPWLIYIGRTAYEATPAMLFYFISLFILLKAKGWRILLAFPFLLLAFYSYIATKLIFLPFILAVLVYCYFLNKKKYLKQYLILFLLSILFILFYITSLKLNPATARLSELLTPNSPGISEQVNLLRKTTITNSITNLLTNKYTIFANIVLIKTLKTFATDYLFISGDEFFSILRHGLFYYIDSVFILLGTLFVFSKKRSVFVFLSTLILIGVVPQVFHTADTSSFSVHSTLMYPFLIILAGAGVFEIINLAKNKNYKIISFVVIFILYIISVANFANIYFYWFPLQGYFDFSQRVVSSYALRSSGNQKVTVYSNTSFDIFKKYIFYENLYNKNTASIIKESFKKQNYSLENVTFKSCNIPENIKDKNNLILLDVNCGEKPFDYPSLAVARLSDGGESFKIYNDKICAGAELSRYPSGIKLTDFNIEGLTNKNFCQTFITSF
jgi:4-amino-4-deoxy-L-arabinose transferase-like glycosyltransferase